MGLQENTYEDEPFLERGDDPQTVAASPIITINARWLAPGLIHILIFVAYTWAYVVAIQRTGKSSGTALHGTLSKFERYEGSRLTISRD
jgi:hypothetical protein